MGVASASSKSRHNQRHYNHYSNNYPIHQQLSTFSTIDPHSQLQLFRYQEFQQQLHLQQFL
ncbi:10906_t:CDS:2 [Ambispora gerdemannii]|uniref:10906_t:CDS:1 n=1 Tax=Ambispora gerdemannii TaxID=144530 RepID=A0A9N9H1V1_9GLOM|nr:10906_t:CDS:2 [Ambispora gerdemannii]